jgi:hypothetical protein
MMGIQHLFGILAGISDDSVLVQWEIADDMKKYSHARRPDYVDTLARIRDCIDAECPDIQGDAEK